MKKETFLLFVLIVTLFIGLVSITQIAMGAKYDHPSNVDIFMIPSFNATTMEISWVNLDFKQILPFEFYLQQI